MSFNLEQSIEILQATPTTLSALLGDLSDDWLHLNEGTDTWSAFDIVGHLIHGEETDWIPRIKMILAQNDTPFEPFDRFAQLEKSKGKSIQDLLTRFQYLRTENLDTLRKLNLSESDLSLPGIHPELGQVTLKNLLATWTSHDLSHISQIGRVMAKRFKNEVGPWHQYMKILH